MGDMAGLTIPPVTDGYIGYISRHDKTLVNLVLTTAVAAEIGTVTARVGIGRINNFIPADRAFLPWCATLFKATILDG